jgi:hypothetical protein
VRSLGNELRTFAGFLRVELKNRIFLRLPALAAMAMAWWLAHAYAESRLAEVVEDFLGLRHGLSEVARDRLAFWLPLFTAALVAYGLHKLTRHVRRIYLDET